MQADERIVNYMKERSRYARTVAGVAAVHLFALAVYFGMSAVLSGGFFYSGSEGTGKTVAVCFAAVIAAGLCVVNILTVIRSEKVYITRPDRIAIRDSEEIVKIAYDTARPVLIYKITYSLVLMAGGGLVYIILLMSMNDEVLAGLYGRIISLKEDTVVFESKSDHSKFTVARWAIQTNLTKHEDEKAKEKKPAAKEKAKEKKAEEKVEGKLN